MSQPRVFITLGRTGQVVERGGTASNSREAPCDAWPRSGSKRSLGNGLRIYPHLSSVSRKRQRGDGTYWGAPENRGNEMGLSANDLRLKLMRRRSKHLQIQERRNIGHMNQNIVKSALPSASNSKFQPMPEAKESFHLRQISYTKNADHMHVGNSVQKLNTSFRILNEAGARPSGIRLNSSGAVTSLTNYDGPQRFSPKSATRVFHSSMPIRFTPTTFKGTVDENAKPVRQLAQMNGIGEKNSQGGVPLTVSGLLHSLGLEKYEIAFRAEEVDMTVLKQMGDKDLKDLGIPMGPRKKILLSLAPFKTASSARWQREIAAT
ncbi:uncharacterized protein LOC129311933 [Prosopis cineraria]|uniref:uncharacterized protein LOC129311933 n=1 Tax=Prosopis cineraria TaxID=364024 RepID=UPI002410421F|nr:uncharacterized protein LOC129311933 [Prosopis cineraria]